jgi:AcrR family transcriptional regulator
MSGDARQRILDAFRQLALESGFDAISVRDVVARAAVARSTFYEHFENKHEGFRAILDPS